MQNSDNTSNDSDPMSVSRLAFAAAGIGLKVTDTICTNISVSADPKSEVCLRAGCRRMRLSRAQFTAKLKAQQAMEARGEVITAARLPHPHVKEGRKYFYEGDIAAYEAALRSQSEENPPIRPEKAQIVFSKSTEHSTPLPMSPLMLTGNVALRTIFAYANISKSQGYKLGLVPMYNEIGEPLENNTIPPFPWLRLPPPIIKTGKKLWNAEDIMRWHHLVRARALQAVEGDNSSKCEVSHGH